MSSVVKEIAEDVGGNAEGLTIKHRPQQLDHLINAQTFRNARLKKNLVILAKGVTITTVAIAAAYG
jgi:hypothetical protein